MGCEVKICGLTNIEDATAAFEFGADYLGFVLYTGSSRYVTPGNFRKISDALPSGCRTVGVFVNESRDSVVSAVSEYGLYAVQLHGDEEPGDFAEMPVPVWRALRVSRELVEPEPRAWNAGRYVADSMVAGVYGGSGIAADWKTVSRLAAKLPVMLAGGLTPENVGEAKRVVCPLGVDVAGGVETSPGKKDLAKMKIFIENAKR